MTTSSRYGTAAPVPAGAVALSALFVTALVTAQVTASKVLAFDAPVALPVTGDTLVLPGAALAYALTFLASDCYAELYGRRAAQVLVNVGFLMNFLVLALVYSTIAAPAVDPEFAATFEANIVLSLVVGQYLLKLLIALLDTPFVYLITGAVRRSESSGSGVLQ